MKDETKTHNILDKKGDQNKYNDFDKPVEDIYEQWRSHEFGATGDQRFKGAPVLWGPSIYDWIIFTLYFAHGRIFCGLIQ